MSSHSSTQPQYYIASQFLTGGELESLKLLFQSKTFRDGLIGDLNPTLNLQQKIRYECYLSPDDSIFFDRAFRRYEQSIPRPDLYHTLLFREPCKIAHYNGDNKGFYNLHRDTQGTGDLMSYRTLSSVVFLSDPTEYDGGELTFPELEVSLKLGAGDAVFFDSTLLHGVTPVIRGERYVLVTFLFSDGSKIAELRGEDYLNACLIAS